MRARRWLRPLRRALRRGRDAAGARPRPDAPALLPLRPPRGDVEFLFLFALNNSGTTVIGRYLEGQTGGYLPPFGNFEGQFAPEVRAHMRARPWDKGHALDWRMIRGAWEGLARAEGKALFIECSPANLVHIGAIRAEFGDRARMACLLADPHAQIASSLFNYARPPLSAEKIAAMTGRWIERAGHLGAALAAFPDLPRLRYETFCVDPATANRAFGLALRPDAPETTGKANDPLRGIVDLTARQHAFLSFAEWDRVNERLAGAESLVTALGYRLAPGREIVARAAADPALMHAGLVRRAAWEAGNGSARRRATRRP